MELYYFIFLTSLPVSKKRSRAAGQHNIKKECCSGLWIMKNNDR